MVKSSNPDVVFFEAFEEEAKILKKLCPNHVAAEFTSKTIQESSFKDAPCSLISIRTQSKIPLSWKNDLQGVLTRSTGFEHVLDYKKQAQTPMAIGYLPSYCARAVAEQAVWMILNLLRKAKEQQEHFLSFCRDGLTGRDARIKTSLLWALAILVQKSLTLRGAFG